RSREENSRSQVSQALVLPCAKCGQDVPEGTSTCPNCGAGMATMMLSKDRRGLTRTLIGKAVELRNSIPWANPSAIMLLDDPRRPGKKKVRPVAGVVIAVLSVAVVVETIYLLTRHDPAPVVLEVATSTPEVKTENVAKANAPAPKPTPAE